MSKLYLKYSGETLGMIYNGTDGKDSVTVDAGGLLEISEEEGGKLLKDFPKDFSKATKKDIDEHDAALKKAKDAMDEATRTGKLPPEYAKPKKAEVRKADAPPAEYGPGWTPPKPDKTWKEQNRG